MLSLDVAAFALLGGYTRRRQDISPLLNPPSVGFVFIRDGILDSVYQGDLMDGCKRVVCLIRLPALGFDEQP